MKSVKYYYSKPAYVTYMRTLLDGHGEVLMVSDRNLKQKAKRVPRICVASVYDRKNDIMYFGVSVCSTKDIFKKAIGREIAYYRALHMPVKKIRLTMKSNIRQTSTKYANEIIDEYLQKYVI